MSKYRITVFYDFKSRFFVVFSSNYRHHLVLKIPFSRPYFSQNLEIPYWKFSFPVYLQIKNIFFTFYECDSDSATFNKLQLNSCNSSSYISKNHLNRRNCLVPSEFASKPLWESSYNLNSYNSKNHLNPTDYLVLWTIFYHIIQISILKIHFSLFVSDDITVNGIEKRRYHVRIF